MMGVFLLFGTLLNSLFRLKINSKFICVCEKIIVVAYTFITLKVYFKFKVLIHQLKTLKNYFCVVFTFFFIFCCLLEKNNYICIIIIN